MSQIGSNVGMVSQNLSQNLDPQGIPIVSSDTFFGTSPAGPALLSQQLFGIANATFELLPPDPYSQVTPDNAIPYWDFIEYSDGVMSAIPAYDSTTATWGIKIDPGTAITNDYATLRTRSYVLTDDNLNLRQTALTVLSKSGTAGGTAAQWQLVLGATYFDALGGTVSSYNIGTVTDVGTWTSLSGTTTAGGSAIGASARYVDLTLTITALGTITGSAAVTVKSALLSSSIGAAAGGGGLIVVDPFTSSGTWDVPTGVTRVDIVAMGAGGGGGAAGGYRGTSTTYSARGGGGGGGGGFIWVQGINVSGSASISVGVGAAGVGGAGTAASGTTKGNDGSAGGAATFGSLVVANGGAAGLGGSATTGGTNTGSGGTGGLGGTVSVAVFAPQKYDGKAGGNASVYNGNGVLQSAATAGGDSTLTGFTDIPYYGALNPAAGANAGATGGIAGIGGGGGGGGSMSGGAGTRVTGTPSNGGAGGGGGGGTAAFSSSGTANGQAGGAAGTASAAGGGGGGVAATSTGVANTGSGGNGGNGSFVAVVYIG